MNSRIATQSSTLIHGTRDSVLDAWRGISILMVVIHHAVYFRFGDIFRGFLEAVSFSTVSFAVQLLWVVDFALVEFSERAGPLGVKIFFVVSGYIITKLLLIEEEHTKTIDILAFYFRRVIRIIPALAVYVAGVFIFSLFGWIAYDAVGLFAALGFVCNTGLDCGRSFVHTWTLSVEEQFYIVWPLLFVFVPKAWRAAFLSGSFVFFILMSILGIFVPHGWINNPLSYSCIVIGALYATSVFWRNHVLRYGVYESLLAVCVVLVLAPFPAMEEFARQIYWSATPFVILVMIMRSYAVVPYLSRRIIVALSTIGLFSYSLYLWQEPFLMEADHYLNSSPLQWATLCIPLALASYWWVEQPLVRWGKTTLRRIRGTQSSQTMPAP